MDGHHPQETIQLWWHTRELELTTVTVIAWLTWDLLINLSDEIAYLWQGRITWIKPMYIFIRYVPIIHQGVTLVRFRTSSSRSADVCRVWITWNLTFIELLTLAVEIVLVIRVFVLYKMNRIISKLVSAIFVVEIILMVTLISFVIPEQKLTSQCVATIAPKLLIGYWVTTLLFEMFLFGLTLAKFLQSGIRPSDQVQRRSFMYIFMRDGTWAFALIFVSMVFSTLMSEWNVTPRASIGYFVVIGVLSFSGSHVILNIRRLGVPDVVHSQSDIDIPIEPLESDTSGVGLPAV